MSAKPNNVTAGSSKNVVSEEVVEGKVIPAQASNPESAEEAAEVFEESATASKFKQFAAKLKENKKVLISIGVATALASLAFTKYAIANKPEVEEEQGSEESASA